MEIPLVLSERRDGRLVYAIPPWYRLLMAAIAGTVAAAFAVDGRAPGAVGWIVLAAVLLAALYEERWTFDAARGQVAHREGLVIVARGGAIEMAKIARFRISPYVRGTIPGTEEERRENERVLSGPEDPGLGRRRASYKKAYLRLTCEASDGTTLLLDTVPERRMAALSATAARIASYCGAELVKGLS